jgi:16S rRNA (guanine966-N2)-methyltransferase
VGVTRIIAGLAGSRKLAAAASATRPTSDRVRESIFGKLEALGCIAEARVLDLYAGTGALGLEGISRGASAATMVEKDSRACQVIRQNIAVLENALAAADAEAELKLVPTSVHRFLTSNQSVFDLVFIDPPYELDDQRLVEELALLRPMLSTGAVVVLERSGQSEAIEASGYQLTDERRYGDTAVYFYARD